MHWLLRAIAVVVMYLIFTLGVAILAHPDPTAGALDASRKFAPLAAQFPGAAMWPALIDLNAKVRGYPLAQLITIGLGTVMFVLIAIAQGIANRKAKDREIEREERIRLRVRQEHR